VNWLRFDSTRRCPIDACISCGTTADESRSITASPGVGRDGGNPSTAQILKDQAIFYNYAAGVAVERVPLAARGWPGGLRTAVVRFGYVRSFDHTTTADYLDLRVALNDPSWLPWLPLIRPVHFGSQTE
jgi:hypothetical protein